MSNTFYTSDLHLGDKTAANYRGFDSVDEHDDDVIESLSHLTKRSRLIVLGDAAFTSTGLRKLKEVSGYKILIMGNHDTKSMKSYLEVFDRLHGFLHHGDTFLSHCPIHPQELYRVKANIHGHDHLGVINQLPFPYINVNWDFWHRPLHHDEIRSFIDKEQVPYEIKE